MFLDDMYLDRTSIAEDVTKLWKIGLRYIYIYCQKLSYQVRHLKQIKLRQESVTIHEGLAEALGRLGDKVPEIRFCDCRAEIENLKDAYLLPHVSMSFQGGCQASQTAVGEAEKRSQRARTKRTCAYWSQVQ